MHVSKTPVCIFFADLLGIAGAAASVATIYATPAEGLPKLGCAITALDCSTALTSQFSKVAEVPLGVFGLFYFVFWTLNLRAFQRTGEGIYRWFCSWVTMLGGISSLVLATIMFFVLQAPCLYCMITHGSNIGALILLWPLMQWKPRENPKADHVWHFLSLSMIALLAAVALFLASENRNLQAQLKDATQPAAKPLF